MAQDKITLYRLALSSAGVTRLPDDPDEETPGARICNVWYETLRDYLGRSAFWPHAKAAKRLGVLGERDTEEDWVQADPLPGWRFAYQAPSDMLAPRYLSTYERFETGASDNKRVIYTDMEVAVLVYSKRETNIALFDPVFFMALSASLAAYVARPLTGKSALANEQLQRANAIIAQARADVANDTQQYMESLPSWISARGYLGGASEARYIAPFGPTFTAPGAPLV